MGVENLLDISRETCIERLILKLKEMRKQFPADAKEWGILTDSMFWLKLHQQVVRCPDCIYKSTCINTGKGIETYGFCKWGKRKEGDGDG